MGWLDGVGSGTGTTLSKSMDCRTGLQVQLCSIRRNLFLSVPEYVEGCRSKIFHFKDIEKRKLALRPTAITQQYERTSQTTSQASTSQTQE
jgi:hypothetical protein